MSVGYKILKVSRGLKSSVVKRFNNSIKDILNNANDANDDDEITSEIIDNKVDGLKKILLKMSMKVDDDFFIGTLYPDVDECSVYRHQYFLKEVVNLLYNLFDNAELFDDPLKDVFGVLNYQKNQIMQIPYMDKIINRAMKRHILPAEASRKRYIKHLESAWSKLDNLCKATTGQYWK